MVIAKSLTKRYGTTTILENIDFSFGNNRKVGLVGRNGCGKSTLFNVIAGIEPVTEGSLTIENEVIGYIPQEIIFPDMMVGEYLESLLEYSWEFYKIETYADQLNFNNFDPYQQLNTMSEGQKMKVKMIEVLFSEPTLLLIDEPTNHLDIEGILWFENYVKHLHKTVIMISHDRSFLNNTVDEIIEIENTKIFRFVGDYDNYKTEKLKLINKWDEEYVRFLRRKAQLETLLANVRKIKGGKARGRAVGAAKKRIEREVEGSTAVKYESKKMQKVDFETDVREHKLMLRFQNVSKSYGDHVVFEDLDFEIRGKEKIWLFGPNGAGKTTLVKMIMGDEDADSGEIQVGRNVKIGYFAQKQTHLDPEKVLLDLFIEQTGCQYGEAFGALKRFLFTGDSVKKKIMHLSPGERARFAFAVFAINDYDMLILDEPSNHLDIEAKEVIEQSLNDFKGTLLLVSHDRYFVESIEVNKMLNLTEGRLELL